MEVTVMLQLLVQVLFSFYFVSIVISAMKNMDKLNYKERVFGKQWKNIVSYNNSCKKNEKSVLTQLPRKEILNYYLIDELYNFIAKYGEFSPKDFDLFSQCVLSLLKNLKIEPDEKIIKSEISKVIEQITNQDTNLLSSNLFKKAQMPNILVESESNCIEQIVN